VVKVGGFFVAITLPQLVLRPQLTATGAPPFCASDFTKQAEIRVCGEIPQFMTASAQPPAKNSRDILSKSSAPVARARRKL
jgi:hypothetical protein